MPKEKQLTSNETEINDSNDQHKRAYPNSPTKTSSTGDHQFSKSSASDHESNKESDGNLKPSTSQVHYSKDGSATKHKGAEFDSAKAEMGQVMEENQRLKQHLHQIMKDYEALQMKFYEITQQDSKNPNQTNITTSPPPRAMTDDGDQEEADFVSLSLGGRLSSLDSKKIIINKLISSNVEETDQGEQSLTLGLDYKFKTSTTISIDNQQQALMPNSSLDNSLDETKEGEGGDKETNGATKRINGSGDDEVVQQPPVKKARVSVRVRCDTPTMNDGCQWRKYGQKIAKGNPCPRAYYRCTVAPSCPVRKQVQRCAEDMSILITTYEGTHSHPLPISATAMASTTSAAAYMLMSGSSTSSHQGSNSGTATTTTAELHGGLNFIPDNSKLIKPFYLPNSSSTFAPPPAHPTITLDLTSTSSSSSTSHHQLNRATCTNNTPSFGPRYSTSTNLNFNYSSNSSSNNNNPPISWQNGLFGYATQPNNKTQVISTPIDHFGSSRLQLPTHQENTNFNFQTLLQKGSSNNPSNPQPLPDTIAKVLTSDPSFQSVLSAALSSFITGNNNGINVSTGGIIGDHNNNDNSDFAQKINKWGGVQTSSNDHVNSSPQSTSKQGD